MYAKNVVGPDVPIIRRLTKGQSAGELVSVIRSCEKTLAEIEPYYVSIRDQRNAVQELLNEFKRLYVTRFRSEPPVMPTFEWPAELVLESAERRRNAVRAAALALIEPGETLTDQDVLDQLMGDGFRFVAENPKAIVSTILNGFKSEFEKIPLGFGLFKRHPG